MSMTRKERSQRVLEQMRAMNAESDRFVAEQRALMAADARWDAALRVVTLLAVIAVFLNVLLFAWVVILQSGS